jgi:hypothetical protein
VYRIPDARTAAPPRQRRKALPGRSSIISPLKTQSVETPPCHGYAIMRRKDVNSNQRASLSGSGPPGPGPADSDLRWSRAASYTDPPTGGGPQSLASDWHAVTVLRLTSKFGYYIFSFKLQVASSSAGPGRGGRREHRAASHSVLRVKRWQGSDRVTACSGDILEICPVIRDVRVAVPMAARPDAAG